LYLGIYPCQYNAFAMEDHIIGQINIKLQLARSIFWEPLGIKIRHVLRLVYRIAYWLIQIEILAPGIVKEGFLKRAISHRESMIALWNTFITFILVSIIIFLVIA